MQKLFEDAFRSAAIGMAIVNPDGRFIRVNRAFCRIVGYSEAEMLAHSFQDITHPDDLDADLSSVRQMIRGEIETYEMEKRYLHKDGRIVWILLSVSRSPAEEGAPRRFFAQAQDITARKSTETCLLEAIETKRRLYDELRAATDEVAKLQEGLLTICAWTKQVRYGKEWKSIEEFLSKHLHMKLTHSISDDAAERMFSEGELEPPAGLRAGPSSASPDAAADAAGPIAD
jgi:PAS domain S-box-containing protein